MRGTKARPKRKAVPVPHLHYLFQPADSPQGVSGGAVPIEALVISPSPRPVGDILKGYCEARGLDVGRFRCRPVDINRENMRRDGRGTLRVIGEDGKSIKALIEWKR